MSSWWERRQARTKMRDKMRTEQPFLLFKFQRPLFTNTPEPTMLVYEEHQMLIFNVPYDERECAELFRGQPKVYAWGRFLELEDRFEFDQSREPIRDPKDFPAW